MKDSNVSGTVFTPPRLYLCSGQRTDLFAPEKQIASCVFCCTKQVLLQKTLASKGDGHILRSRLLAKKIFGGLGNRYRCFYDSLSTKKANV
ncbi:hypothetical protein CLI83_03050 [Porphyromonas gingivalis]|nr:hypothetical protein CLI83_03050 [Porphyromonas gingivalis]PDP73143.1 hypothetical protein CLI81_05450 [Porphyromonas gingivalis]